MLLGIPVNAMIGFNTRVSTSRGHNYKAHGYNLRRGAAICKQQGSSFEDCVGWFHAPANRTRITERLENVPQDL